MAPAHNHGFTDIDLLGGPPGTPNSYPLASSGRPETDYVATLRADTGLPRRVRDLLGAAPAEQRELLNAMINAVFASGVPQVNLTFKERDFDDGPENIMGVKVSGDPVANTFDILFS
jgi:hypothetical protein